MIGLSTCNKDVICDTCQFARQKFLPFPHSISYTNVCFEMIHVDIWGPFQVVSYDNYRYFLTIVDDFTRCTWLFLMIQKSEARQHIVNFYAMVKTQFSTNVKCIRSDNV